PRPVKDPGHELPPRRSPCPAAIRTSRITRVVVPTPGGPAVKRRAPVLFAVVALLAAVLVLPAREDARWWSDEVGEALQAAGPNRPELEKALRSVPVEQRKGMAFLIANMPERDRKELRADFLLENVALAYKARKEVAWGDKIPEEVFLNNVLPYANVDESRDPWRKELYELCMPLVKDCKTPGEAGHLLNTKLFEKLKVRYSTQRKQANQSPKESIGQGQASCTGLSILLSN